jgi:hypothetical protein
VSSSSYLHPGTCISTHRQLDKPLTRLAQNLINAFSRPTWVAGRGILLITRLLKNVLNPVATSK